MILSMNNIYKDYPMGRSILHVLKDVSLEVNEGDYIAIMGPSGSGKSTLMNIIGCLDVPTSGTYILGEADIGKCSDNKLAEIRNRDIGFVFQQFNLLPRMTALDNVALPLLFAGIRKGERRKRAAEALKIVGLEDRMTHTPDQLSGGQCQRVAIARAIVGKPKLLLADEPTGALDSTSGRQVMELFHELHASGSTIIMITHDANIAGHAETVYHIFDGVLTGGGGSEPAAEERASEEETLTEPAAEEQASEEETLTEPAPEEGVLKELTSEEPAPEEEVSKELTSEEPAAESGTGSSADGEDPDE